jgi:hypothetical protein
VTRKASAETTTAWVDMYEEVFFVLMQGIVKSTAIEEEYAGLGADVRNVTQQEMHRIARRAAERFVQLANPNPVLATKDECDKWKREAIEYALRKRK